MIGHEEIASATIYNSIKNNSSANAFVYGIRGIGKTTFARIVAKALNCEQALQGKCEKNAAIVNL